MQNNSNIFEELHRTSNACINDIDEIFKSNDVDIEFVAQNKNLIQEYFIKNYKEIRKQFLNNPSINVLSYDVETIKVANQNYNIVSGNSIAKSLICSNKFLKNIIKACLYYVDIELGRTKKMDNINDLLADTMTSVISDFKTCYHETNCEYSIILPLCMSSILIKTKSKNTVEEIYMYCTFEKDGNSFIETTKVIHPPIDIKLTNSNYVILEEQVVDYVVGLINIIFFIKKQHELNDPKIILRNSYINSKVFRYALYNNRIIFLHIFISLVTIGVLKIIIDGIPGKKTQVDYIIQNNG